MGESTRLRLFEIKAVIRLIAECRELGADHVAWRTHLLFGAMKLVGARVGLCGEISLTSGDYPNPQVELGWQDGQGEVMHQYWRQHLGKDDVFFQRLLASKGKDIFKAVSRQQYVTDSEWYRLWHVDECLRTADIDSVIMSGQPCLGIGPTLDRLSVFRDWGEQEFGDRERQLIQLLHDEIGPMIGRQLADADEAVPSGLSPRKQQVLECLLEGDTDQQIASHLGISRTTVSEYVSEILRHFGVGSRSQLLAHFLRRCRTPRSNRS